VKKVDKSRKFYGLLSLLTLLLGIIIYLIFRDISNMVLFTWIQKPQFLQTTLIPLKQTIFSDFLKYHLPDMLWFVSAVLFIRFIWFFKIKIQTVYILSFYAIGLAFEISQLSKKVPGTFDCLDIFFMGIAAFVEGIIYRFLILRRIV